MSLATSSKPAAVLAELYNVNRADTFYVVVNVPHIRFLTIELKEDFRA